MGTTASGLPYPEPTDDLRDGAGAIQALAEALVPFTGDTGWVDVTVTPPYVAQGTGDPPSERPMVRRIGNVVYARGGWSNASIVASTTATVGVVPAGFRPGVNVIAAIGTSNAKTMSIALIFTGSGNVQIRPAADLSGYYMLGVFMWITDEPWPT